jgi:hypothetical protein
MPSRQTSFLGPDFVLFFIAMYSFTLVLCNPAGVRLETSSITTSISRSSKKAQKGRVAQVVAMPHGLYCFKNVMC